MIPPLLSVPNKTPLPDSIPGIGSYLLKEFGKGMLLGSGMRLDETERKPAQTQPSERTQSVHIIGSIPLPVYIVGGNQAQVANAPAPAPSPLPVPVPVATPVQATPPAVTPSATNPGLPASFFGPWNTANHGLTPNLPDWQGSSTVQAAGESKGEQNKEIADTLSDVAETLREATTELKRIADKPQETAQGGGPIVMPNESKTIRLFSTRNRQAVKPLAKDEGE